MATLNQGNLTLADWIKRQGTDKKVAAIVELLSARNEILEDMVWVEGNLPTGHRTTIRSGLPSVTWRLLNYGVQPSKSKTVQVTDSCGMLEAYSDVDKALADLNGDTPAFRWSEDQAFLEAMNQDFASTLFYGNTGTDPEKFMGLSPRYSAITSNANIENILNGGTNDTDNTSIWLITWGDLATHGIFPKGSQVGLHHEDKGQVTLDDAAGGHYEGYRSHFKWDCGLVVRDWRSTVRICNIEVSDIVKGAATGADLITLMVQAIGKATKTGVPGRMAFYCNEGIQTWLQLQIINKANVNLTFDTAGGKPVLRFNGIPVRRCDAILDAEAALT